MQMHDTERITKLVADTVSMLCKNSVHYNCELKIQGLIGVTSDSTNIFIVQISEVFGKSKDANSSRNITNQPVQEMAKPGKALVRRRLTMPSSDLPSRKIMALMGPPADRNDDLGGMTLAVNHKQETSQHSMTKLLALHGPNVTISPSKQQKSGAMLALPMPVSTTPFRAAVPQRSASVPRKRAPNSTICGRFPSPVIRRPVSRKIRMAQNSRPIQVGAMPRHALPGGLRMRGGMMRQVTGSKFVQQSNRAPRKLNQGIMSGSYVSPAKTGMVVMPSPQSFGVSPDMKGGTVRQSTDILRYPAMPRQSTSSDLKGFPVRGYVLQKSQSSQESLFPLSSVSSSNIYNQKPPIPIATVPGMDANQMQLVISKSLRTPQHQQVATSPQRMRNPVQSHKGAIPRMEAGIGTRVGKSPQATRCHQSSTVVSARPVLALRAPESAEQTSFLLPCPRQPMLERPRFSTPSNSQTGMFMLPVHGNQYQLARMRQPGCLRNPLQHPEMLSSVQTLATHSSKPSTLNPTQHPWLLATTEVQKPHLMLKLIDNPKTLLKTEMLLSSNKCAEQRTVSAVAASAITSSQNVEKTVCVHTNVSSLARLGNETVTSATIEPARTDIMMSQMMQSHITTVHSVVHSVLTDCKPLMAVTQHVNPKSLPLTPSATISLVKSSGLHETVAWSVSSHPVLMTGNQMPVTRQTASLLSAAHSTVSPSFMVPSCTTLVKGKQIKAEKEEERGRAGKQCLQGSTVEAQARCLYRPPALSLRSGQAHDILVQTSNRSHQVNPDDLQRQPVCDSSRVTHGHLQSQSALSHFAPGQLQRLSVIESPRVTSGQLLMHSASESLGDSNNPGQLQRQSASESPQAIPGQTQFEAQSSPLKLPHSLLQYENLLRPMLSALVQSQPTSVLTSVPISTKNVQMEVPREQLLPNQSNLQQVFPSWQMSRNRETLNLNQSQPYLHPVSHGQLHFHPSVHNQSNVYQTTQNQHVFVSQNQSAVQNQISEAMGVLTKVSQSSRSLSKEQPSGKMILLASQNLLSTSEPQQSVSQSYSCQITSSGEYAMAGTGQVRQQVIESPGSQSSHSNWGSQSVVTSYDPGKWFSMMTTQPQKQQMVTPTDQLGFQCSPPTTFQMLGCPKQVISNQLEHFVPSAQLQMTTLGVEPKTLVQDDVQKEVSHCLSSQEIPLDIPETEVSFEAKKNPDEASALEILARADAQSSDFDLDAFVSSQVQKLMELKQKEKGDQQTETVGPTTSKHMETIIESVKSQSNESPQDLEFQHNMKSMEEMLCQLTEPKTTFTALNSPYQAQSSIPVCDSLRQEDPRLSPTSPTSTIYYSDLRSPLQLEDSDFLDLEENLSQLTEEFIPFEVDVMTSYYCRQPNCSFSCATETELAFHYVETHTRDISLEPSNVDSQYQPLLQSADSPLPVIRIPCPFPDCERSFPKVVSVISHHVRAHKYDMTKKQKSVLMSRYGQLHQCMVCRRSFTFKSDLVQHISKTRHGK